MRKSLYPLLILVLLPLGAHAYTVQSVSVSSSDTGGISAGSGETVVSGSSDVSSEIHTFISGGSSGGTADVNITTEQNGVRQTETKRYVIPQGGSVVIDVATSSRSGTGAASGAVRSSVRIGGGGVSSSTGQARAALVEASSSATSASTVASSTLLMWLSGVSNLFSSLFGHLLFFFPFRSN